MNGLEVFLTLAFGLVGALLVASAVVDPGTPELRAGRRYAVTGGAVCLAVAVAIMAVSS